MRLFFTALLVVTGSHQVARADDYTCRITNNPKLADYTLRVDEEGKSYKVSLKSEKPPQVFEAKGALKIESTNAKKEKSLVFSGESITLNLNAETRKGGFIGVFRSTENKRRKSFGGEIQCD